MNHYKNAYFNLKFFIINKFIKNFKKSLKLNTKNTKLLFSEINLKFTPFHFFIYNVNLDYFLQYNY